MNERILAARMDMEKTRERTGKFIGRLGDLGLGSEDGIPSNYVNLSNEALQEKAEQAAERLVEPTDLSALSCIDGRSRLGNADGSKPEVRLRRVGGTASNLGVSLNAEASITDTLLPDDGLQKSVGKIDEHLTWLTDVERSAHQGGCGGANGEMEDHEAIHTNPTILQATKTFLEIPEVNTFFLEGHEAELGDSGIYSEKLAGQVREAAGKTALYLREEGWNGQKYVEDVAKENPRGVEDLEVDPNDKKFHGHKEDALEVIIGDKTSASSNFAWNLKASKMIAEALAGQRGTQGYQQAVIAEVAKHMAVANRLPSKKTPIFLLTA